MAIRRWKEAKPEASIRKEAWAIIGKQILSPTSNCMCKEVNTMLFVTEYVA